MMMMMIMMMMMTSDRGAGDNYYIYYYHHTLISRFLLARTLSSSIPVDELHLVPSSNDDRCHRWKAPIGVLGSLWSSMRGTPCDWMMAWTNLLPAPLDAALAGAALTFVGPEVPWALGLPVTPVKSSSSCKC